MCECGCECVLVCLSLWDGGVLFLAYRSIVQYQWEPCLEYGSHWFASGISRRRAGTFCFGVLDMSWADG